MFQRVRVPVVRITTNLLTTCERMQPFGPNDELFSVPIFVGETSTGVSVNVKHDSQRYSHTICLLSRLWLN